MIDLLLATSVLLGALAFFEPCTIATHTLFTVRAHGQGRAGCCQSLLAVWVTRSVLVVGLLAGLVWVTEPPVWGPYAPSAILSAMATIYLVSRFIYLPVPHLALHRLLPRGGRWPQAVQLGLTLPACTIPLFVVVAGIAVTVDSVYYAALAGLLFAGFFTLPMVLAAVKGVHEEGRDLLSRAATGSPFLTAALLYGFALYLLVPALDLSADTLSTVLEQASWLGIGLGFLAGFVFSFNTVAFASIPVVLAYVTKAHEQRRAIVLGGAFIAGIVVTHVVLGVAAALGGEWVQGILGRHWGVVLGPLLILLGLLWPGWLK